METNAVGAKTLHVPAAFGDLPQGWQWDRLNEVCEGVFDCPHSTPKLTATGPYVVRTQDISTGTFREDRAAHVSEETYLERTVRVVPSHGDLLYSREGTYFGIAAEVPKNTRLCLGQRMVLIRPISSRLDFRFLRYWLNSPTMAAYINGFRDGSVAERLNLPTIRSLPVLLPPIEDQRNIAEVLNSLDEKMALNERIVRGSRDLGRAVFAHSIDSAEVVVMDVEVASISSLVARGGAPSYVDDPSQTVVLNQRCIRDGRVDLGPARLTISTKVRADRLLQSGDVLVNSTGVGTLGRVAIWNDEAVATCDSHITIVRINASVAEPIVAGYAMLIAQPEIEELGEGSTGQTELGRQKLGRLKLRLPSRSNQAKLVVSLDALEQRARCAVQENAALVSLRDALLPRLVSGELRINDAELLVSNAL